MNQSYSILYLKRISARPTRRKSHVHKRILSLHTTTYEIAICLRPVHVLWLGFVDLYNLPLTLGTIVMKHTLDSSPFTPLQAPPAWHSTAQFPTSGDTGHIKVGTVHFWITSAIFGAIMKRSRRWRIGTRWSWSSRRTLVQGIGRVVRPTAGRCSVPIFRHRPRFQMIPILLPLFPVTTQFRLLPSNVVAVPISRVAWVIYTIETFRRTLVALLLLRWFVLQRKRFRIAVVVVAVEVEAVISLFLSLYPVKTAVLAEPR